MNPSAFFMQKLAERERSHLQRRLTLPQGEDFCSNDYLGFAQDSVLQKSILKSLENTPSGSGGSRLLRGHQSLFEQLERRLAQFSGREAALFFPSGYQSNIGLLSAILDKESLVISDELNHASLIDGIRLSGCRKRVFAHNDLEQLESILIEEAEVPRKIIVVESLYSMMGDLAPLSQILDLAERHGAQVIVDEAHSTGVYGAGVLQKRGYEHRVLASVHSGAKALGVSGSWVACDQGLKDFLINFSRPFIYSTAPSPLVLTALLEALNHYEMVGQERAQVCLERSRQFRQAFADLVSGEGPIFFMNLGESAKALKASEDLLQEGYDVRAIRYPTVPEGQAGLRLSIHSTHSEDLLQKLIQSLRERVLPC